MTEEEFQRALKLEGIFLPSACNQRAETYGHPKDAQNPQARYAHYTTAEAALSIITNKCIWMRGTTSMADFREVIHGHDILIDLFHQKGWKNSLVEALDSIHPGCAVEAIGLFDQWWNDIRFNTFITSVSEHSADEDAHGRLSMWRALGRNIGRVAIILKVPWRSEVNSALNLMFSPVVYSPLDAVHAELLSVLLSIRENSDFLKAQKYKTVVGSIFNMLRIRVACVKHEGFREEKEWRAIYSPKLHPSDQMQPSTEVVDGIPQILYKIPLDAIVGNLDFSRLFERLIIGPSPYPWQMYEAFRIALDKAGVTDSGAKIITSGIPIRG